MAHPPQWADQVGNFVTRSSSGRSLQLAKALSGTRVAALYFHERMHTTQLYFGVFAAVWLACLLWMKIARRRLAFRRGGLWVAGITLLVFSSAALYGLGTRGVLPQRTPALAHFSDAFAAGFLLTLPLITWFRVRTRSDEGLDGDREGSSEVSDRLARLGSLSVVPHTGPSSPLPLKPEVQLEPEILPNAPVSAPQPSAIDDHTSFAANRLIARMTAPALDCQMPIDTTPAMANLNPISLTPVEAEAVLTESIALDSVTSLALTRLDAVVATVPPSCVEEPSESIATVIPEPAAIGCSEPMDIALEPAVAFAAEPAVSIPSEAIAVVLAEETVTADAEPVVADISEPVSGVAMHLTEVVFPKCVPATPDDANVFETTAVEAADRVPPSPEPSRSGEPTEVAASPTTSGHDAPVDDPEFPNGTEAFRHDLLGLYKSWQRIETMQGEIDDWFEQRRRQAIAHVATPPAMRTSGLGRNLVRDFPAEKMNAIESEWAEIRNLAIEISRSVGEVPNS